MNTFLEKEKNYCFLLNTIWYVGTLKEINHHEFLINNVIHITKIKSLQDFMAGNIEKFIIPPVENMVIGRYMISCVYEWRHNIPRICKRYSVELCLANGMWGIFDSHTKEYLSYHLTQDDANEKLSEFL